MSLSMFMSMLKSIVFFKIFPGTLTNPNSSNSISIRGHRNICLWKKQFFFIQNKLRCQEIINSDKICIPEILASCDIDDYFYASSKKNINKSNPGQKKTEITFTSIQPTHPHHTHSKSPVRDNLCLEFILSFPKCMWT